MKNKLFTSAICFLVFAGLVLIGVSFDKLLHKDGIFLLTGFGLGLLVIARYLETRRRGD